MEPNTSTSTIEDRQEKEKQALIEALKEMPIIQVACKRAGVSRATYYRWRQEDKDFMRKSRDALDHGIEFINDMSESQLVTLIKEKKMPAIALWLKHHHAQYGSQAKPYVPIVAREDLTSQEEQIMIEALAFASGKPIKKKK